MCGHHKHQNEKPPLALLLGYAGIIGLLIGFVLTGGKW